MDASAATVKGTRKEKETITLTYSDREKNTTLIEIQLTLTNNGANHISIVSSISPKKFYKLFLKILF